MKKNILIITVLSIFVTASNASATEQNTTTPNATSQVFTPSKSEEGLVITDDWASQSIPSNNNSAAYMKISNNTDKDIVIIGAAASETANNVELHESFVDEKGISRMRSVDRIVVPARTGIEMVPGATHIMLFDLKKALNAGNKFNIEVKIEGSKPLIVNAEVK